MALSNFYLTDRGNALMAQTLTGTTIKITKAQIGEGTWPDGTTFANVAALVAPIKDLAIARKRADSNGQTIITVQFSTEGIGRAFNWSEFALWAADPTSPDDRTKDFILGTSRALAAEEAVHFDAIKEEFNFNVILKTSSADAVEIIFEGSTVYPALDPDGGLTLEGGLKIAGGQGAFVSDAQGTIMEHRKDGNRFGFVVYPDMPIEERYKIFDEVDGVIRQYEILHTGMKNIATLDEDGVLALQHRSKLLTNEDLNDIIAEGYYRARTSQECLNVPDDVTAFGLAVLRIGENMEGGGNCNQILVPYGSVGNIIYTRIGTEGAWDNWRRIALADQTMATGNILNIDNIPNDGMYNVMANAMGTFPSDLDTQPEEVRRVGVLIHKIWDGNYAEQMFFSYASAKPYHRKLHNGAWLEWDNVLMGNRHNTIKGELQFENFGEYYMARKGRTIADGKTHFLTMGLSSGGSTTLEHYTCDSEEFDGTKLDGRLELGQVAGDNNWLNTYALVLRSDNANGPTYRIYGEHFSPAVIATAELV